MISYNGDLIPSESSIFSGSNRGFQYGDGIFETIVAEKGRVKFQEEHWERIEESMDRLKLRLPFLKHELFDLQLKLLEANRLLNKLARMKLYIWRKAGGLYTPSKHQTDFLMTADISKDQKGEDLKRVGVARTVQLQKTAFSHLKTLSALPYVLAGIEKNERGLEELILLNTEGYIAEASAANVYFMDNSKEILYTPSLDSGCINGVSRRFLMTEVRKQGWEVEEIMWKRERLHSKLSVFTSNVTGISFIREIENQAMGDHSKGFKFLKEIFR